MSVLYYGLTIFFLAFLIHFFIWRLCLTKKNHTLILLEIFFGVLVFVSLVIGAFAKVLTFGIAPPQNLYEYIALFLLYSSMTLAYIASYSAVEVDSPSLTMILDIARAMPAGLEKKGLYSRLDDKRLVISRLNDLVNDRMVSLKDGRYRLTRKGAILADVFICFRRLLKAPKGG